MENLPSNDQINTPSSSSSSRGQARGVRSKKSSRTQKNPIPTDIITQEDVLDDPDEGTPTVPPTHATAQRSEQPSVGHPSPPRDQRTCSDGAATYMAALNSRTVVLAEDTGRTVVTEAGESRADQIGRHAVVTEARTLELPRRTPSGDSDDASVASGDTLPSRVAAPPHTAQSYTGKCACGKIISINKDGKYRKHKCNADGTAPRPTLAHGNTVTWIHDGALPPLYCTATPATRVRARKKRSSVAKRETTRKAYEIEHVRHLEGLAEDGITKGTFTHRYLDLLNHNPPGTERFDVQRLFEVDPEETALDTPPPSPNDGEALQPTTFDGRPDHRKQQVIKLVVYHLANNNIGKARQAASSGAGVRDINDKAVEKLLRSKYPPMPDRERQTRENFQFSVANEGRRHELVPVSLVPAASADLLENYILGRKRSAARSITGHSNDEYMDIIRKHPQALSYIHIIAERINNGCVIDGDARALLMAGKGTALPKGIHDIRPTASQNPLVSYAGVIDVAENKDDIDAAAGPEQLIMKPSGTEVNGHACRHKLEKDTTKSAATYDMWNAYNDLDHPKLLARTTSTAPGLTNLAELSFGMTPMHVVFSSRKRNKTIVVPMEKGVPQGGTASTAFFVIAMGEVMDHLRVEFDGRLTFSLIGDNITAIGQMRDCVDGFTRTRELIAELLGGRMQDAKSTVYSLGDSTADDIAYAVGKGMVFIPKTEGFKCAGTPIGSDSYVREMVNQQADDIVDELEVLKRIVKTPDGKVANAVQAIYQLIRMCTTQQLIFLLRVCTPSNTLEAAQRVDGALANAVFDITNSVKLLPEEGGQAMSDALKRLFLTIRNGGDGFMNAEASRLGAYIGSITGCADLLSTVSPGIKSCLDAESSTPAMKEFYAAIELLRDHQVDAVNEVITDKTMWDLSQVKVQKLINDAIGVQLAAELFQRIPVGYYNGDDPDTFPVMVQAIANTNFAASGWLTANPSSAPMPDEDFNTCFQIRNLFDITGSRTHCLCSTELDLFCDHCSCCALNSVKTPGNNRTHTSLKRTLRRETRFAAKNANWTVIDGEPPVDDYLIPRTNADGTRVDPTPSYSDIGLAQTDSSTILIDTTVSATANGGFNTTTDPSYTPGKAATHAENLKDKHYSHRYIANTPNVTCVPFGVEVNGTMGKQALAFVHKLAQIRADTELGPSFSGVGFFAQLITQRISVALGIERARKVRSSIRRYTLDRKPTFAFQETIGIQIPPTDPPLIRYPPHNTHRLSATTPIPRRTPLIVP
jgi:hypothetical protein